MIWGNKHFLPLHYAYTVKIGNTLKKVPTKLVDTNSFCQTIFALFTEQCGDPSAHQCEECCQGEDAGAEPCVLCHAYTSISLIRTMRRIISIGSF